jgi:photosystem II stability/assembly factor-like uncharacterized protein
MSENHRQPVKSEEESLSSFLDSLNRFLAWLLASAPRSASAGFYVANTMGKYVKLEKRRCLMRGPANPESGHCVSALASHGFARSLAVVLVLASDSSMVKAGNIIEPFQPNVWPGGRAVAVTVSPNNSSIAIVASESGGLFQTRDGGITWTHLSGLLPFRMADVKYSPVSSERLVATTFADSRTGNRGGIWRSVNGGSNWQKPATSNPPAGPKCPAAANAYGISYVAAGIFVGTDCGVAVSRDSGATWRHMVPDPSAASWRILSVVAHGQGIVDACGDAGIYRSLDNGTTWGPASTDIGGCTQLGTHLIDASPFNPDVLFVTTFPDNLFESDNGGRTWTTLNPPAAAHLGRPSWLKTSTALPNRPNQFELFFGNPINVTRQTCTNQRGLNCTGPWTAVTVNPNGHEPNGFSFNASGNAPKLLVTDAGVYGTVDGGTTFAIAGGGTGGFNALQVYEVAGQVHPAHTDLFIGTQDNCLWASADGGRSWVNPRCPEGFALQMKRRTPSHAGEIVTGTDIGFGNFRSSDHFANFDRWNDPPNNAGNPFIIDTDTYIQYVRSSGTPGTGIAITTNGGRTWNPVTILGNPTTPFTIAQMLVHFPQIVGSAGTPRIYQAVGRPGRSAAGPNIGLLKIDLDVSNRTATSSAADVAGLGSLGAYGPGQGTFLIPAVFGADPNNPQHVIAPDVASGEMKVTNDGGNTWTALAPLTELILNAGQFLFNVPGGPMQVHAVGFDPDVAGRILVGTEAAGIFESTDGGQHWEIVPYSDYFIRSISNFFFDRNNIVVAATYGHGLWKLVPGSLPPPTLCTNIPSRCTIDVRTPMGERIYPRWACPRAPDLPTCQVIGLTKGLIEDIELSKDSTLKRLALSGDGLRAYDIDGRKIDPSLPVVPVKTTSPGKFSGCTTCLDMIKQGGAITGFIIAKDRVAAIIAQFPGVPGTSKPPPISDNKGHRLPNGTLPYLHLVGTIPVTGQSIAATGDTIEVYGSGFCPTPRCSPVTIRIGDRVVAKSVDVDDKGTFKTIVKVTEMAGQYRVGASQKTEKGEELRDERMLAVPVLDRYEK